MTRLSGKNCGIHARWIYRGGVKMPEFEVLLSANQYVTVEAENEEEAFDRAILECSDDEWEVVGIEIVEGPEFCEI